MPDEPGLRTASPVVPPSEAGIRGAPPRARRLVHVACLSTVLLVGGLYVWHYLDRGWWPNNAGAFALAAERVHGGELPHRDFDEIYTGGLEYFHALAFDVFGTNMAAIRRALFAVFLTWIPALYYLATRFATPIVAGLGTLLAVAWCLPIYSEPIASWYNLFFATHGLAALLRHFETGKRRWLFVVGVCAGLSLLAKVIGVYFLTAVFLALLHREQRSRRGGAQRSGVALSALIAIAAFACVGALFFVVFDRHGLTGVLQFVLPIGALAAVVVANELAGPGAPAGARLAELFRLFLPVGAAAFITVAPFLAPYVLSGSVGDLVTGLFVQPQRRLSVTTNPPPMMSPAFVALVLLLVWVPRWPRRASLVLATFLLAAGSCIVVVGNRWPIYPIVIGSIRSVVPASVVAGSVVLLLESRRAASRDSLLFASIATAGLCNLVQFPVAETIYIYFAAPLGVIAMLAVVDRTRGAARAPFVVVVAFYIAFSVTWIHRSIHRGVPNPPFTRDDQTERLDIDRAGGIRVRASEKREYEDLIATVRRLAGPSKFIYATPDCPEVYFLAGYRNPTRTTYDFFDEPEGRVERIEEALVRTDVRVVVLSRRPQYSAAPSEELVERVVRAYPESKIVGGFEVRWKP